MWLIEDGEKGFDDLDDLSKNYKDIIDDLQARQVSYNEELKKQHESTLAREAIIVPEFPEETKEERIKRLMISQYKN
jgi:hypothetical protein